MNYGVVIKVLGNLLAVEAVSMIPALALAIYFDEGDKVAFARCIVMMLMLGYIASQAPKGKKKIKAKEGFTIVTLGWVVVSFFGALPFVFSGTIPSLIDAFFETVSGFTTTGATIIDDIEVLPKGILFWRSFTHWVGGMGILVFTVAILPAMGVGSFQIFKAESPGPVADKIVPRIKDTAKLLYKTYLVITVAEIILLMLGGMNLYEAALHTFGTVGTGGFSTRNASIGAFSSSYIQVVIAVFMIMSGVNFSLYYELYKGKWKDVFKNEELRLYLSIIGVSVALIAININSQVYKDMGVSLRHALFQVSSIITTTGYATVNFDEWSTFSKGILFMLMFVGGCAGSTGGGMKNIRILVLLKLIKREVSKILHPRAVISVKVADRALPSDTIAGIASFFVLYMVIFALGTIVISLEGISLISASSAVAATLGNIGPGFEFVGPATTYSKFSDPSKLLLSFFMLLGRLELFTVAIFLTPKFWREEI